jgi:hypothetical protein
MWYQRGWSSIADCRLLIADLPDQKCFWVVFGDQGLGKGQSKIGDWRADLGSLRRGNRTAPGTKAGENEPIGV